MQEADVEVEYYMPNDILLAQKDIHPQLYILTAGLVVSRSIRPVLLLVARKSLSDVTGCGFNYRLCRTVDRSAFCCPSDLVTKLVCHEVLLTSKEEKGRHFLLGLWL